LQPELVGWAAIFGAGGTEQAVNAPRQAVAVPPPDPAVSSALRLLPGVPCLMSSCFDGQRVGVLVERVMRCADEPACVVVALRRGHRIDPIIRDAHCFALSVLRPRDKRLARRLAQARDDPFDSLRSITLASRCPVLCDAAAGLDCEVIRHFDFDTDHELFVGRVVRGWVAQG